MSSEGDTSERAALRKIKSLVDPDQEPFDQDNRRQILAMRKRSSDAWVLAAEALAPPVPVSSSEKRADWWECPRCHRCFDSFDAECPDECNEELEPRTRREYGEQRVGPHIIEPSPPAPVPVKDTTDEKDKDDGADKPPHESVVEVRVEHGHYDGGEYEAQAHEVVIDSGEADYCWAIFNDLPTAESEADRVRQMFAGVFPGGAEGEASTCQGHHDPNQVNP